MLRRKQGEEHKNHTLCVYVSYDGNRKKNFAEKENRKKIKWGRSLAIKSPLMQFMDTLGR